MVSHLILSTTLVLASLHLTASQICGNTGDCDSIISPLQCVSSAILSTCCSKCISLAGCQNLGLNCANESPLLCYQSAFRQNCCAFCQYRNKTYLGNNCLYGDKAVGCGDTSRCGEESYATQCCETCFNGAVPTFGPTVIPTAVTTPAPTAPPPATTAPPPATTQSTAAPQCVDTRSTCDIQTRTVPSDCYQADMRQACCGSCALILDARRLGGVNISICPFGDRGAWCLSAQFDRNSCSDQSISFSCCDTCLSTTAVTTAPPTLPATTLDPTCRDTGVIANCDLPDRFCYTSVSTVYSTFCCATCAAARRPDLGATCLYGDNQEGCADLVTPGVPCTQALNNSCCASCQAPTPTTTSTTADPCQDTLDTCPGLISNNPASCYLLEGSCCRSCRQFFQLNRTNECRFGDRIPGCGEDLCDALESSCCATCADRTTTKAVTTIAPCVDAESNCELLFGLDQDPSKCYNDDVRSACCASCRAQATGPLSCPYGDRDSICRAQITIDCQQLSETCCKRCASDQLTTQGPTAPQGCNGDTLATCSTLLQDSLRYCYTEVSALVSTGCCSSCFSQVKQNLPAICPYGDKVTFCNLLASEANCENDAQVRLDCCESCYYFVSTTTIEPTGTPDGCVDVYNSQTCELLQTQLGSCATIEDKCCASCRPTTTASLTTEDPCTDVFGSGTCQAIITAEGDSECYSTLLQENCCGTCKQYVTPETTSPSTTPKACPDTQLPNCEAIQAIVSFNICNDNSTFASPCCEYCKNITTTTSTPACSNSIDTVFCEALIQSSTADNPCNDVTYIIENCCGSCDGTALTTTTPAPTTTPGIPCDGDEEGLNCTRLNDLLGTVCDEGSLFANACCAFCRDGGSTTTPTPSPVCAENLETIEQCRIVYTAAGGTPSACASDYMIENCCHFCANLPTVPPTTPDTCTGDDPLLNCSNVFLNIPTMCEPDSRLRESCCDFCRAPPVSTTTATTVDSCQDNDSLNICAILFRTNGCATSTYANESCCATCRDGGLTTVTTQAPTTTTMAVVTSACVDTTDFDCANVDQAAPTDNLCDRAGFSATCCAYCSQFTTITPIDCYGDQLDPPNCQNQIDADNTTCTNAVLRVLCCASCGFPVIGDSSTPTQPTTTTLAPVTPDPACQGDTFQPATCDARIALDANTCNDPTWLLVCCETCNNQGTSRRKRSAELSDIIVRSKRATCTNEKDYAYCENAFVTGNDYCLQNNAVKDCCDFCSKIDLSQDCQKDLWETSVCKTIVDNQGLQICLIQEAVGANCCLRCYLEELRVNMGMTTAPTQPPTTPELACVQQYSINTCQAILQSTPTACTSQYVLMRTKCCNFCTYDIPTTPATIPTTPTAVTTQPTTTTTVSATPQTANTAPVTTTDITDTYDAFPTCGIVNRANTATCDPFVNDTPSECYSDALQVNCCEDCTKLYYERKTAGFNVEYCSYGNRMPGCTANANCSDPTIRRNCCDICYTRKNVELRPVVPLTTQYMIKLRVEESACVALKESDITTRLDYIFAHLPGDQVYTNFNKSCDTNDVSIVMTTPSTHTYEELEQLFEQIKQDNLDLPIVLVDSGTVTQRRPVLLLKEYGDRQCSGDVALNCRSYELKDCSNERVFENCCEFCIEEGLAVYSNRTYIPIDCPFGDAPECSSTTDCNAVGAQTKCCYSCALPSEEYTTPAPPTTITSTTPTQPTEPTTTTAPVPTTTVKPCLGNTGERNCMAFTQNPINCYVSLVYDHCCESCNGLARWDLPATCPWGDKEVYCGAVSPDQCEDGSISENVTDICCDRCGPHLTTTSTTITPTTTTVCIDGPNNCGGLTAEDTVCYDLEEQCCATCKPKIIDYLPYDCRFGDKLTICASLTREQCDDAPTYRTECCQLCGPEPPTTTTTTAAPTTTTTPSTTVTTVAPCRDSLDTCFEFPRNLCYNDNLNSACCNFCESKIKQDTPYSCRYGDHKDCSNIDLDRCSIDADVATDCCESCQNSTLPPDVCIDKKGNCDLLTEDVTQCYTDFVRGQCCETCERRSSSNSQCKWGDRLSLLVCNGFTLNDCKNITDVPYFCCEHCIQLELTTTTQQVETTTVKACEDTRDTCYADINVNGNHMNCYKPTVAVECCASCDVYKTVSGRPADCPFGDKESFCSYLLPEQCSLNNDISETCCELCASVTPTRAPVTTPENCENTGTQACNLGKEECYDSLYRRDCCRTCAESRDLTAQPGCEYGDRRPNLICPILTRDQCANSEARQDCCSTCARLLATTPVTTLSTTPTVTEPSQRATTQPTTVPSTTPTLPGGSTPSCSDDSTANCQSILSAQCYDSVTESRCCNTCGRRIVPTASSTCKYGDRDSNICTANVDCRISAVRDVCCFTCRNFIIPSMREESYRLQINVTSQECTPSLLDKTSVFYAQFNVGIQNAVEQNLLRNKIPGSQSVRLTDISCGSVLAIFEMTSIGFYDVGLMGQMLNDVLRTGSLGSYGVSPAASYIQAVSFEPPACSNGDTVTNCLSLYVLNQPSLCYQANVRNKCCRTCSSLFYANLAENKNVATCAYGDKDAGCFIGSVDCMNENARSDCCESCADFALQTTTTTTAPSTVKQSTTPQCMNQRAECISEVERDIKYCYENKDDCCASCRDSRILGYPPQCAWGDQAVYCQHFDTAQCLSVEVNSTCCALCNSLSPVTPRPTDPPATCTGNVQVGAFCAAAGISPESCYDPFFYSQCCSTCDLLVKTNLPQGCSWGDKSSQCTANDCLTRSDECCETCCTDASCLPVTTTATTRPTQPPTVLPVGCNGDRATNCASLTADRTRCYTNSIYDACCSTCSRKAEPSLPQTCKYGSRSSTCALRTITEETCSDGDSALSEECCAECYNLVAVNCSAVQPDATNCEAFYGDIGQCYVASVRQRCCNMCKNKIEYSLPSSCRFGDKSKDCAALMLDQQLLNTLCFTQRYQEDCCSTCRNYIGLTTQNVITTTTATVTTTETTRLPPSAECPNADIYEDCPSLVPQRVGACYDIEMKVNCCSSCYNLFRSDLPNTCRYGDRSVYCQTTDNVRINREWCELNGETCCDRCSYYNSLTPQCPTGNTANDCSSRVEGGYSCYSPITESNCCLDCQEQIKPDLSEECKYGDAAKWCADINPAADCPTNARTCCETCKEYLTTLPTTTTTTTIPPTTQPTLPTTTSTTRTTVKTTTPTTLLPTTRPVATTEDTRPFVHIGEANFNRPTPPGDYLLFAVSLRLDNCIDSTNTIFLNTEEKICETMKNIMRSLTSCMVSPSCSQGETTVYVVVNKGLNYNDNERGQIENTVLAEISEYNSQSEKFGSPKSSDTPGLSDVNECTITNTKLKHGCHQNAQCSNLQNGLYTCSCGSSYKGDGFTTCRDRISPLIGRGSFVRSVPPARHLYEVTMNIDTTNSYGPHRCFDDINKPESSEYAQVEQSICNSMAEVMWSLSACYVQDFDCDSDFRATVYVLVDSSKNYAAQSDVTPNVIKAELESYPGTIHSQRGISVIDIDECNTLQTPVLHKCVPEATCRNTIGFYTCTCPNGRAGWTTCDGIVATTQKQSSGTGTVNLTDWMVALIVLACVIVLIIVIFAIVMTNRRRTRAADHRPLGSAGEETPPLTLRPALYNSIGKRPTTAQSDIGSYFYPPAERELPGYAMKTYNQDYNNDIIVFD